ncbi:hypothetical protein CQW23_13487 [Capsicum baccatum]|uniref:Uncharacterized protein n=1 Tax=Capsicum baccatum TaxID=33114 RepID=A0A2G2WVU3_CAPBA|nr:hypothetical protein CQW23_13487 [Capsicum baccatum]
MSGKEDASAGGADGSQEPCQLANRGRIYWWSASWLSSRTSLPWPNPDIKKVGLDPNGVAKDKDILKQNGITHVFNTVWGLFALNISSLISDTRLYGSRITRQKILLAFSMMFLTTLKMSGSNMEGFFYIATEGSLGQPHWLSLSYVERRSKF